MSEARTILIVEDEPLISMMLEDFLLSMGHQVSAICETVDEAITAIDSKPFDIAILDVNLRGESVWPVAYRLKEIGTPFVLASGGHVEPPPSEFASVPLLDKPYTIDRVGPALDAALTV